MQELLSRRAFSASSPLLLYDALGLLAATMSLLAGRQFHVVLVSGDTERLGEHVNASLQILGPGSV